MTQKEISIQNQAEINALIQRFEILEKTASETSSDVKRILFYFNSDDTTKTEGIIERSNRHEKELKWLTEFVGKGRVALWTVGFISSFLSGVLVWILKIKGED